MWPRESCSHSDEGRATQRAHNSSGAQRGRQESPEAAGGSGSRREGTGRRFRQRRESPRDSGMEDQSGCSDGPCARRTRHYSDPRGKWAKTQAEEKGSVSCAQLSPHNGTSFALYFWDSPRRLTKEFALGCSRLTAASEGPAEACVLPGARSAEQPQTSPCSPRSGACFAIGGSNLILMLKRSQRYRSV